LSSSILAVVIFAGLSFGYLTRLALICLLIDPLEYNIQAIRQFFLELGVFIVSGLGMATFNMLFFDFPFGSGLKLTIGCMVLGFFVAADLTLIRERKQSLKLIQTNLPDLTVPNFFPLTRKFTYLGSVLTIFAASILISEKLTNFSSGLL
jgi:hypothetical protein